MSTYLLNLVDFGLGGGELKVGLLAFIVSVIVVVLTKEIRKKKYALPPGPRGLPIVGYLPFIGKEPYKVFNQLRSKYGNVFGLYLGQQYTLILNDIASIKEAYSKNDFSGRPIDFFKFTDIYDNILNMNGKLWVDHMRFNKTILRELGMGKNKVEEAIKDELSIILGKLSTMTSKDEVDMQELMSPMIDNVIYSMICGKRYEDGDPMAKILHDYQIYIQRYFGSTAIHAFIPWLKEVCLFLNSNLKGAKKAVNDLENALVKEIEDHEKSLDANNLTDFLDYSLMEINRRNGKDGFTKNFLNGTSQIFLLGGSETTRTTLEWTMMLLAAHPDKQEKAYQEIVSVCGTERIIEWDDRDSLQYVNAVILEAQRIETLVPLNVLRRTQRDTTVGGFEIPANTTVITNIWAVHMDPETWDEPKLFKPERFMIDGKTKAPENLIPFSYGERMCPGKGFAAMQVFIILTNFIQKFKFSPPSSGLDFSAELRAVYVPIKSLLKLERR